MHCNMILAYPNKVYTDFDKYFPDKVTKRKLLGEAGGIYTYTFSDISKIAEQCDFINLVNPCIQCNYFKFAFEEVLSRVDYKKVRIGLDGQYIGQITWEISNRVSDSIPSPYVFNPYESMIDSSVRYSNWVLMFMYGFYKLYDVEGREENRKEVYREISKAKKKCSPTIYGVAKESSSSEVLVAILDKELHVKSNIDNYSIMEFKLKPANSYRILWGIFKEYDGRVFPVRYNSFWNNCLIAIDKTLDLREVRQHLWLDFSIQCKPFMEY